METPKTLEEVFKGTGIKPEIDEEGNTHWRFKAIRKMEETQELTQKDKEYLQVFNAIFREVFKERRQQDVKWGIQEHPSVDETISSWLMAKDSVCQRLAEKYEIPTEERAKFMCDEATKKGELTWAHIAVEELSEVIGCLNDDTLRRQEIIQLIAVLVAWVECIDRNGERV